MGIAWRTPVLWAAAIIGLTCKITAPSWAQQLPQVPDNLPEIYKSRELAAPAAIRHDLAQLRKRAITHSWAFQVGYTAVFDKDLATLASTRIPSNYLAVATAQHEYANRVAGVTEESARLAGVPSHSYLPGCDPAATAFNWRSMKRVTPVKNQQDCGSCWAFSAAESYEDGYMARTGKVIQVSPQSLLDCSGKGDCRGGWYYDAFKYMQTHGAADEADLPYANNSTNQPRICDPTLPIKYRALNWDFVSTKDEIPLASEIKRAVCAYGPVSTAIAASVAFTAYVSGVFNEDVGDPRNHAVTIVGWDDDKRAWLIRNDWDVLWGDGGFGWVDYDTASIGYAAAWVEPADGTAPFSATALTAAFDLSKANIAEAEARLGSSSSSSRTAVVTTFNPQFPSTTSKPATGSKVIVFIQYASRSQLGDVAKVAALLKEKGFFVATGRHSLAEFVGPKAPKSPQVRYYHDAEATPAASIADVLQTTLGQPVAKLKLTQYVRGSSIEVWFPRS